MKLTHKKNYLLYFFFKSKLLFDDYGYKENRKKNRQIDLNQSKWIVLIQFSTIKKVS